MRRVRVVVLGNEDAGDDAAALASLATGAGVSRELEGNEVGPLAHRQVVAAEPALRRRSRR